MFYFNLTNYGFVNGRPFRVTKWKSENVKGKWNMVEQVYIYIYIYRYIYRYIYIYIYRLLSTSIALPSWFSFFNCPKSSTGVGEKGPIEFLCHNSSLCYATVLNFCRNTTSVGLNTNWYNLASMLQCTVYWKPFLIWCVLTAISLLLTQLFSSFKSYC